MEKQTEVYIINYVFGSVRAAVINYVLMTAVSVSLLAVNYSALKQINCVVIAIACV